ncbi:MAG: M16 family metallopeptidase [Longimicrobiales bacterium]
MSTLDRTPSPPLPGEVRPFELPAVTRSALDNGIEILSARHGVLPVVTVAAAIDAGVIREDAAHAGLAWLTAATLDTGAGALSGDALAYELESLGAELETEATWDTLLVRMTVPSERFEPALRLLAELLRRPTFPTAEVERLREEQRAEILQRAKEPRALGNDMIARFVYGKESSYGRPLVGLAPSLIGLGRIEVADFHAMYFTPQRTDLIVVGDIDAARARAAIEPLFADWTGTKVTAEPASAARQTDRRVIHLVHRAEAVQSEIRVSHVGVDRKHPDYFAIRVMNTILGGAFTSRLNLNLREKHGFTYGVRSSYAFRRFPGPFLISTAVSNDVTARAIEEILKEVDRLRTDGVSGDEVDNARDYLAGILPLEIETTDQVAVRLADLAVYGLPIDYFSHYRTSIAHVSREAVDRAARDHLDPERFTIVVVGNSTEIADPLAGLGFGEVERHDEPE